MPKKTRKMKQRTAERRESRPLMSPESAGTAPAAPAPMPGFGTRAESTVGRAAAPISYDYSHIYGDLKRIAFFAALFFAVLIALSFVIK